MATNKLSDGVGKKIVEALKKQSEIEINPIATEEIEENFETFNDESSNAFNIETDIVQDDSEGSFLDNLSSDNYLDELSSNENEGFIEEEPAMNLNEDFSAQTGQVFTNYPQSNPKMNDTFIKELDNFEIPSNITVLKKLISQLPSGVSRHTGAQIIKQTMEALGISMKSVLQEAQQVQDGLNNSAKECHTTIQEYKKQIKLLEKQAQNYQKQYMALNELISLFIQTGI